MPERLRGFTTRRYVNPLYLPYLTVTVNSETFRHSLTCRTTNISMNIFVFFFISERFGVTFEPQCK